MRTATIIIPTYNRIDDLLKTLPQLAVYTKGGCEVIIYDQSDSYNPEDYKEQICKIFEGTRFIYIHSRMPSVPLAWNTAASISTKDILIFLDDDIDIEFDIVSAHQSKYLDRNVVGVAGGYYASSHDRVWSPSYNKNGASTVAGVNASFLKDIFLKSGAASSFVKPFAGFDWEIAEHFTGMYGKIAVGDDILVFHRAPLNGGCENQKQRGLDWYYGAYHNHFLWMQHRQFPQLITRLPRHLYWIFKYVLPPAKVCLTLAFLKNVLFKSMLDARKTYIRDKKLRGSARSVDLDLRVIASSGVWGVSDKSYSS